MSKSKNTTSSAPTNTVETITTIVEKDANGATIKTTTTTVTETAGKIPTDIFLLLDRSGSMSGSENDVVGGTNSFITEIAKTAKDENIPTTVTRVQFDDKYEVDYSLVPIADVEPLTKRAYEPRGSTDLYGSIGKLLDTVRTRSRELNGKVKLLLLIFTDGEHNATSKYTAAQIKSQLDELQKVNLTVTYMGSDHDSWSASQSLGIDMGNVRSYGRGHEKHAFCAMAAGASSLMSDQTSMRSASYYSGTEDIDTGADIDSSVTTPAIQKSPVWTTSEASDTSTTRSGTWGHSALGRPRGLTVDPLLGDGLTVGALPNSNVFETGKDYFFEVPGNITIHGVGGTAHPNGVLADVDRGSATFGVQSFAPAAIFGAAGPDTSTSVPIPADDTKAPTSPRYGQTRRSGRTVTAPKSPTTPDEVSAPATENLTTLASVGG